VKNADGSPDGGVDLFTIAGRSDTQGRTPAQPDFERNLRAAT
jgi:hypothetical protein